jgi:hypothetical protein
MQSLNFMGRRDGKKMDGRKMMSRVRGAVACGPPLSSSRRKRQGRDVPIRHASRLLRAAASVTRCAVGSTPHGRWVEQSAGAALTAARSLGIAAAWVIVDDRLNGLLGAGFCAWQGAINDGRGGLNEERVPLLQGTAIDGGLDAEGGESHDLVTRGAGIVDDERETLTDEHAITGLDDAA